MKSEYNKWEVRFFRGRVKGAQNTWSKETGKATN